MVFLLTNGAECDIMRVWSLALILREGKVENMEALFVIAVAVAAICRLFVGPLMMAARDGEKAPAKK